MKFLKQAPIILGLALFGLMPLSAQADVEIDNSETEIGMSIQEYNDNSFVEIPLIKYDGGQEVFAEYNYRNPTLQLIENSIDGQFLELYRNYWNEEAENSDVYIATYPFDNGDVIQLVITADIKPEGQDRIREVASYAFRRSDNAYLELDYALGNDFETADNIIKIAKEELSKKNVTVESISIDGFIEHQYGEQLFTIYLLGGKFDKNLGDGMQEDILTLSENYYDEGYTMNFIDSFAHPEFINHPDHFPLSINNPDAYLHFNIDPFYTEGFKKYEHISLTNAKTELPLPKDHNKYWEESLDYKNPYDLLDLTLMNAYNLMPEKEYDKMIKVIHNRIKNDVAFKFDSLDITEAYGLAYIDASKYAEYSIAKYNDSFEYYEGLGGVESGGYASVHTDENGVKTYSLIQLLPAVPDSLNYAMVQVSPNSIKIYNWETGNFDELNELNITIEDNVLNTYIPESDGSYVTESLGGEYKKGTLNMSFSYYLLK